jgi:glycosyltransferase 2 family protein
LLLLLPHWLQPLLLRLERQRARPLGLAGDLEREVDPADMPSGYPLLPLLAQLGFVLLRFGAFLCCVMAFDLQLSLGSLSWLAAFALAWTAGLVVPGAPGGLGVFEAVLLMRLAGELPQASLLAVALSYRLVVTLADVLLGGLVSLDRRLGFAGGSSQ